MKFVAAGDMLIQQRIQHEYPGFKELASYIKDADARFFNLETTLNHEGEATISQFSGGSYLRVDPEVLDDLKPFGFNMMSFNNNHALDFFYDGLEATIKAADASGLVHAGVGRNLEEASAPKYLSTPNGRVALISVSFSFDYPMLAGQQTGRIKGRPGINGIRLIDYVEAPKEIMEYISKIGDESGINDRWVIARAEGYLPPRNEDEGNIGFTNFKLGEKLRFVQKLNETDMKRLEKSIYEAKLQADYIMISVHAHDVSGGRKENVPEYLVEFARRCVDMGASAIVGHGPHLLRPIEVYKDCPIFYSLGDFALQLYSMPFAPEEFFSRYGLSASQDTVHELLKKRSRDFTVGLMEEWKMCRTVMPLWETDGTKLKKITLVPVEMPMDCNKAEWGLPRFSKDERIFELLKEICPPHGVTVELNEDGLIECKW